jgi:hypothetical protein
MMVDKIELFERDYDSFLIQSKNHDLILKINKLELEKTVLNFSVVYANDVD